MDMPGVCQVPESSGEQCKMEETGSEVISGIPMTLEVKGQVKVKVKVLLLLQAEEDVLAETITLQILL